MTTELSQYLEDVRRNLKLNASDERDIIDELETHIEDKLKELAESGLTEEEASQRCMTLLGSAKLVARQLYESHSQASWRQTLLASTPHLLFGLSFALNWFQHLGWLSLLLVFVLGGAIYGWWRGRPAWVFPWLGYSLLPVLAVGLLLMNLPRDWSLLAVPLYLPLALWWLYRVIAQAVRRDWLLSSLMLLPLPIVAGWFFVVESDGISTQSIYTFAPSIGMTFLVLALSIATFVRLRQRRLRIATLALSAIVTLGMVVYSANGRVTLPAFLALVVVTWGLFLVPPLLERKIRDNRWWSSKKASA